MMITSNRCKIQMKWLTYTIWHEPCASARQPCKNCRSTPNRRCYIKFSKQIPCLRSKNGVSPMSKLFTVAGVSTVKNVVTYRFTTQSIAERTATLKATKEHTNIKFVMLPKPMCKEDAIKHLNANGIKAVEAQRAVLAVRRTEIATALAAKAKRAARVKQPKVAAPKAEEQIAA